MGLELRSTDREGKPESIHMYRQIWFGLTLFMMPCSSQVILSWIWKKDECLAKDGNSQLFPEGKHVLLLTGWVQWKPVRCMAAALLSCCGSLVCLCSHRLWVRWFLASNYCMSVKYLFQSLTVAVLSFKQCFSDDIVSCRPTVIL